MCILKSYNELNWVAKSYRKPPIRHSRKLKWCANYSAMLKLNAAWLAVPLFSVQLLAADVGWPRFRGPGGFGVADGQKPPVEYGLDKNLLWKTSVPSGASSPCIQGGRIFLTAFENGKLFTLCLEQKSGKELWRRDAGAETIEAFLPGQGSPAAATPVTDGKLVVVYFGSCGLIAYDYEGKELWREKMPVAETNNDFGSGTSPILEDGLVVLVRDLKKDSSIQTFDAATGKRAWTAPRPGMATGYSTPIVWDQGGFKELIAPGGLMLKAYDLKTGAERWSVRDMPAVNCGSPVVGGGLLYFAGWSPAGEDAPMPSFDDILKADTDSDGKLSKAESENTMLKGFFSPNDLNKDGFITREEWDGLIGYLKKGKNRLVAVKPGGSGDITETHVVWQRAKALPYVPSALHYRGRVFLIKDGGLVSCYDALTGEVKYEQERLGVGASFYASPVAADGHIYVVDLAGKAVTLAAGDKLEVLWKTDLGERTAATPAIVDNTLYYRTESKLVAFKAAP